jgi:hypothetical protein
MRLKSTLQTNEVPDQTPPYKSASDKGIHLFAITFCRNIRVSEKVKFTLLFMLLSFFKLAGKWVKLRIKKESKQTLKTVYPLRDRQLSSAKFFVCTFCRHLYIIIYI